MNLERFSAVVNDAGEQLLAETVDEMERTWAVVRDGFRTDDPATLALLENVFKAGYVQGTHRGILVERDRAQLAIEFMAMANREP